VEIYFTTNRHRATFLKIEDEKRGILIINDNALMQNFTPQMSKSNDGIHDTLHHLAEHIAHGASAK
jgi:hypothetical protein